MKLVEQYQCPQCFGLHDEKFDAQTCCEREVSTVFANEHGEQWSREDEARHHFYLKALQDGKPPLDAQAIADGIEVVYAE